MSKVQNTVVKFLVILSVLVLGFFSSQLIAKMTYNKMTKGLNERLQTVEKAYADSVAQKKDVYGLTLRAHKYLQNDRTDLAIINLERALEVNPKYRDAWILLGYAQLALGNKDKAIESLGKAEAIDPINTKVKELKSFAKSI